MMGGRASSNSAFLQSLSVACESRDTLQNKSALGTGKSGREAGGER